MFGLLYQECLQTGPPVFIWIFHFILPRVIMLFRVYPVWWIISFTTPHPPPLGEEVAGSSSRWGTCVCCVEIMAPGVCDRCLISLQCRQHHPGVSATWEKQKPCWVYITSPRGLGTVTGTCLRPSLIPKGRYQRDLGFFYLLAFYVLPNFTNFLPLFGPLSFNNLMRSARRLLYTQQ